jgi:hypothetical protein
LREAIAAANNTPGDDTIAFNIPASTNPGCNAGTGLCTLIPASELLTLTGGGTTVSTLTVPYLTATATDAISGTSEFSSVFTYTVTGVNIYLPMVLIQSR